MSDRSASANEETDRATITGIWERVEAELGGKPLDAWSVWRRFLQSERVSSLETKIAAAQGGYKALTVSIPTTFAWQIVGHLKRTPPGKGGRRQRSWDESRAFKNTVTKARQLKVKLMEEGNSTIDAEAQAAATYGAKRAKGRKRRAGQRYAADTIARAMKMKPR